MSLPLPPRPSGSKFAMASRFLRDPIGLFEDVRKECGDLFALPIPGMGEWICVCSPELLREVDRLPLGVANPEPIKSRVTGGLIGKGSSLFLKGEEHLRRQKIVIRHFTAARLARHVPHMAETARRRFEERSGSGRAALLPVFHRLALEVAIKVTLGNTFDAREQRELTEAFEELADKGLRSPLVNIPPLQKDWGPWSPWGRIQRIARRTRRVFLDSIDRAVREQRVDPDTVLASLLEADIDRDSVVDELFTLLFGGHESTGAVLCWTVRRLLEHPRKLARLRAELDSVVPDGGIERDDLRRLPYLGAVVRESLRSSPIGPVGGGRVLEEDCELGGYRIAKGSTVVFGLHSMAHRTEDWEGGAEFRPERFLEKGPTSAWVPFGVGHRVCTGKALALIELQVVLGTLVRGYELEGEMVEATPARQGLVFAPADGLRLALEPRDPRASSEIPIRVPDRRRGSEIFSGLAPSPLFAESGIARCPFHRGN